MCLANGAACSIGDQLHPEGLMDKATYALIRTAYKEVEEKEKWCYVAKNIADVALLSLEAYDSKHCDANGSEYSVRCKTDEGALRILLEGKFLFDIIDLEEDFNKYKVLILPDKIRIDNQLKEKIESFLCNGGKILATGESGLWENENGEVNNNGNINKDTSTAVKKSFAIDLGVKWLGENLYRPDYFRPNFELKNFRNAAFVMYSQGQKIELDNGVELGRRENPYFNRDIFTFCSHKHTPNSFDYGGSGMIESSNGIYIAWNLFEEYATIGSIILKDIIIFALEKLLGEKRTLITNLPAQGIVTLTYQEQCKRYVNHLLYASPVRRGESIEIIEDIIPIYNVEVAVKVPLKAKNVYLAPQNTKIDFKQDGDTVKYTLPKLECHQMIVIE